MVHLTDGWPTNHLHEDTKAIIGKERERRERHGTHAQSKAAQQWQHAAALALRSGSHAHYKDQINISAREHMSEVDCFDGGKARKGGVDHEDNYGEEDLPTIHPTVDGRLKNEAGADKLVKWT